MMMRPKKSDNLYLVHHLFPGAIMEYRFHPVRRWKMDYAWPDRMIALEIEGGIYTRGRHTRGKGYEGDCIKYSTAAVLGWCVIRSTYDMLSNGIAFQLLEQAMNAIKKQSKIE